MKIIIDERFKFLLPPLDEKTYRDLEANILEYGCLVPLTLWKGILIDGYNRYMICTEHNIPFSTTDMEFDSREETEIWIIKNQTSRRNLTPIQLSYFRGIHYNADKKLRGGIDRFSNDDFSEQSAANALNIPKSQNGTLGDGSTSKSLAQKYKVSRNTIIRDSKLANGLSKIGEIAPEIKGKILSGEVRIGKSRLEALADASESEVKTVVSEIENGTFVSRSPRNPGNTGAGINFDSITPGTGINAILPEIKQLNKIISDFANNFNSVLHQLNSGDSAPLKEVLRSYIDELEELYQNLKISQ